MYSSSNNNNSQQLLDRKGEKIEGKKEQQKEVASGSLGS